MSRDGDELRALLHAFEDHLSRAPVWSAIVVGRPDDEFGFSIDAGCFGGISWYWSTAGGPRPSVFVDGEDVLLQDYLAIRALAWSRSLTALERRVGDRWVRVPLSIVRVRDPGVLPIARVTREWGELEWAHVRRPLPSERAVLGEPAEGFERYLIGRRVFDIVRVASRFDLSVWHGTMRVRCECEGLPFPVPDESEIVDGRELGMPDLPDGDSTEASTRRLIPVVEGEDGAPYPWKLQDYDLAELLGLPGNVDAQHAEPVAPDGSASEPIAPEPVVPDAAFRVVAHPGFAVPGVARPSPLDEPVAAFRAAVVLLRERAAVLSDGDCREGVRAVAGVQAELDAAWLGLVADLDGRPHAVPGTHAGKVAQGFLTGG